MVQKIGTSLDEEKYLAMLISVFLAAIAAATARQAKARKSRGRVSVDPLKAQPGAEQGRGTPAGSAT